MFNFCCRLEFSHQDELHRLEQDYLRKREEIVDDLKVKNLKQVERPLLSPRYRFFDYENPIGYEHGKRYAIDDYHVPKFDYQPPIVKRTIFHEPKGWILPEEKRYHYYSLKPKKKKSWFGCDDCCAKRVGKEVGIRQVRWYECCWGRSNDEPAYRPIRNDLDLEPIVKDRNLRWWYIVFNIFFQKIES